VEETSVRKDGPMRKGDLGPRRSQQSTDRPGAYRIAFVCSGNICRSPMAEVIVRALAQEQGLDDVLVLESSGIGDWHVGERADHRAVATLAAHGYDGGAHRAREFDRDDFANIDLVVALDRSHERALRSWARTPADRAKVRLLRSFDPDADGPDVVDPYYGDDAGFADTLGQLEAAAHGLLAHVRHELGR
jgi:protein-tyrosine phosphatase